MSMQDTVADMLTRIRNAQMAKFPSVSMPSSTLKVSIANVLVEEGFLGSMDVAEDGAKKTLNLTLRYFEGQPVIQEIKRFSRQVCVSTREPKICRKYPAAWVCQSSRPLRVL